MSDDPCGSAQIVVMAKRPIPGRVKTRLIPRFGADGAAALAEAALSDTLDAISAGGWARRVVALDGDPDGVIPDGFHHLAQRGDGLDERIASACHDAHRGVPLPVLVIGADTPQVTPAMLADAATRLSAAGTDAVLGPAADGGYWILGLRRPERQLVEGVPMSKPTTGAEQLARLRAAGLVVQLLGTLRDVDTPADVDPVASVAPHGRFAAVAAALASQHRDGARQHSRKSASSPRTTAARVSAFRRFCNEEEAAVVELDALENVIREVVAPNADAADRSGQFPRGNIEALAAAGFLGLVSADDVGGAGGGVADAALVVERLAGACASTAMVMCMHYSATAVTEAHGDRATRTEIAHGRHLTTLAFSERGSRSHFWAPLSSARTADGDGDVRLDAEKSWVTAAGEADSYVWSSRPLAEDGASTLWLVPAQSPGLKVDGPFDGLGLRANASSPVTAVDTPVPRSSMLGPDGGGLEIMLGVVLPWFSVLTAACCVGTMDAAVDAACAHAASTRLEHLDQVLADNPVTRAHLAHGRILTDQVRTLLGDTIGAIGAQRDDATLRVLELKAAAADAAIAVTDLAMRVCGGAAFRRELAVERHFRDARAAAVMAPTSDALHDFIGRAICGLPVF